MARPSIIGAVFEKLLRSLMMGTWPEGGSLPPVRAMALEFGVSPKIVGAALRRAVKQGLLEARNRQSAIVTSGATERAREILSQMAEKRDRRQLAILIPETICPPEPGTYWCHAADVLCGEARRRGLEPNVVSWPLKGQVPFVRSLSASRYVAAVAFATSPSYLPSVHELERQWFPLVLHNRRVAGIEVPGVIRDDYAAAWRLGELLTQFGHRNMMMFANVEVDHLMAERNRVHGWVDFLQETGLVASCTHPVYYAPRIHYANSCRVFRSLLDAPNAPTAVVMSVNMGRYIEHGVFDGIRVPEDLSVAAFDPGVLPPIAQARHLPQLTSVRLDHRRVAQCCLEVIERMLGGEFWPPTIRVPLEIELTESIGRPLAACDPAG